MGYEMPIEQRKKIGLANRGKVSWMKGIPPERHWNWQGGKSFEPYSADWQEHLRQSIRRRDGYICQLCYLYGNSVHHIDYDKKNCKPDNLIVLCISCNSKVNANRKYWTKYFWKIIEIKYDKDLLSR